jgi:hypothetical protein
LIKFNSAKLNDLEDTITKLKKNVTLAARDVIANYAYDLTYELSEATPLGNVTKYYSYYVSRYRRYNLRIQEGFAKGNWRVVLIGGVSNYVQSYESDDFDVAQKAYDRIQDEYRIGRPVYIVNNAPYLNHIKGFDTQTLTQIFKTYQYNEKYREKFLKVLTKVR